MPRRIPFLLVLTLLAVNAAFLYFNAFRTFYFLDMGPFIDGAWRLYCGQIPTQDFIVHCAPIHHWILVFLSYLVGFNKWAMLLDIILISSIVILITFWISWKRVPIWATFLCSALAMTSFYWPMSHPWYNHTAHLFGIIAVAALIRALPFSTSKTSFKLGFLCGAMACLSLLTKPNIGLAYTGFFAGILLIGKYRFRSLLSFAAGFGLVVVLIRLFMIPSYTKFMEQVFFVFAKNETGRFHRYFGDWTVWFRNYYWIVAACVGVHTFPIWKKNKDLFLLFIGIWVVGIFATYTSTTVYEQDVQLMGPYLALGFILFFKNWPETNPSVWKKSGLVILVGFTLFLTGLYAKYGYEIKAWAFPDHNRTFVGEKVNPVGTYRLRAKRLEGWLCNSHQGPIVDAIVDYFNAYVPKTDSLLILTDMQILYSLTDHDSYRGIPWGLGVMVSPAPGKQRREVRNHILANPPIWIVTHKSKVKQLEFLVLYLDLAQEIKQNYVIAREFDNYILLRRKNL